MERESIIDILNDLCRSPIDAVRGVNGIFGPDSSMAAMGGFMKVHEKAFGQIDFESLDILFDILQNPPNMEQWHHTYSEDFTGELLEAICAVGRRDAPACLKKVEPLLQIEKIRPEVIYIMDELGHQAGVALPEELSP